MTASFHRLVSSRKSLIAAIVMALTLLGTAGTGASATADAEANLPPSSRADYHGTETAVCEELALYAGMSSNARSIALIEGKDPANCSTAVAGVQEAPVPELPLDLPQGPE